MVSSSLVDAELKPKRHSWFETLSCMFEKMKVGGSRKRTTSPSTPRISASHSTALNTAHRKLISLRHAFQCKNKHCKKQKCPKTKLLLVHVSTCKNKDCDVPDCIISRRLLSHYRYCTNMECPLCMPIRVVVAQDVCQKRRRESLGKMQGKRRRTESVIALLPSGSPPMPGLPSPFSSSPEMKS